MKAVSIKLSALSLCLISLLFSHINYAQITLEQELVLQQLRVLSADDMAGREAPSKGYEKAKSFIIEQFKQQDLLAFKQYANYQQPFLFGSADVVGTNIIGYIAASKYVDKYLLLTAHYDHLGAKGKRVFNGANDNASGVIALLSLMKHFSITLPLYNLVFVATDAEESGLHGAKYLAKHLPIAKEQILLNINLDMIGDGGNRNTLYFIHSNKTTDVKTTIKRVANEVRTEQFRVRKFRPFANRLSGSVRTVDWKNASDHAAFRRIGIPYLYFGTQVNKVYHTEKDDFARIDKDFFLASVLTIIKIVEQLQYLEPNALSATGSK